MDAISCIKSRKSIRGFKPDPVERELLLDIIDTARWSPSYKNTQPWEVVVLSGARKAELSKLLVGLYEDGVKPSPDIPHPESWPLEIDARIAHLMKSRSEASGIDLTDPEVQKRSKKANFNFYHAPHVFYIFQDSSLNEWSIFDIGLFAQSIMLAANAHGIGTVPQAFATDYSSHVKDYLGIPKDKRLVLGISAGYPDPTAKVNEFRTDRAGLDDILRWVE